MRANCYNHQARIGPVSAGKRADGAVATTRVPPEPGAGDDAAADAGHQAAAALEPRSCRLRRRRTRENPLLERDGGDEAGADAAEADAPRTPAASRRGRASAADWTGEELETSRSAIEAAARHRARKRVSRRRRPRRPRTPEAPAGLFGMGGRRRRRPRRRRLQSRGLRLGRDDARRPSAPSSWRWRSPIRRAG